VQVAAVAPVLPADWLRQVLLLGLLLVLALAVLNNQMKHALLL
jgi:hypothetical protein